jgi:hypothetical protein
MGKCGALWKKISNVVAVKSPAHIILFIVNIIFSGKAKITKKMIRSGNDD